MSGNTRDTQFQGFASLLWIEIMQTMEESGRHIDTATDPRIYRDLIARRAYDWACHVTKYVGPVEWDDQYIAEIMAHVTDMDELPKEQE